MSSTVTSSVCPNAPRRGVLAFPDFTEMHQEEIAIQNRKQPYLTTTASVVDDKNEIQIHGQRQQFFPNEKGVFKITGTAADGSFVKFYQIADPTPPSLCVDPKTERENYNLLRDLQGAVTGFSVAEWINFDTAPNVGYLLCEEIGGTDPGDILWEGANTIDDFGHRQQIILNNLKRLINYIVTHPKYHYVSIDPEHFKIDVEGNLVAISYNASGSYLPNAFAGVDYQDYLRGDIQAWSGGDHVIEDFLSQSLPSAPSYGAAVRTDFSTRFQRILSKQSAAQQGQFLDRVESDVATSSDSSQNLRLDDEQVPTSLSLASRAQKLLRNNGSCFAITSVAIAALALSIPFIRS